MAQEFIWDKNSTQTYTKIYGSQQITDARSHFWKNPGADFTMDAEGETLTLTIPGVEGEESMVWWPSSGMRDGNLKMNIINGNLVLDYDKYNRVMRSGLYLANGQGNTAPLFLTLNNASQLNVKNCPFITFGLKDEFSLNMSGSSRFSIDISAAGEPTIWNKTGGTFNLNDNASFLCDFSSTSSKYEALLFGFFATLNNNAQIIFTDSKPEPSKIKFAGEYGVKFDINGETSRLIFMAKGHPLFGAEEIADMNQGTFNFITKGTVNNSEIVLQNAGKDEINAFCKTGAVAIDDQPQLDDKNLNFGYDDALPGLRISVKH
ncbi:hypothetical protein [Enterobacter ludwigii]|uniref:hypothetical protein n=1 Tax=Enterobacter ludwigii TaxID=299767 RepID=UPI0030766DF6